MNRLYNPQGESILKSLALACSLLALAGCAESLDLFHRGNKIIERHVVPPTWNAAGRTTWTECRPDQLVKSAFWAKSVCPDTYESNAPLAVEAGHDTTQSYVALVVPSAISGALIGGGIGGGLAAQKAAQITQRAGGLTINENFSTKFIGERP